jgi:predicted DNA-binding transcriptional regulator AlpA
MISKRADGLGHWEKGKRRHSTDVRTRRRLQAAIRRALNTPSRNPNRPGRTMSRKEIAALVGVNDKTVARWYADEDFPSPETAAHAIRVLNAVARRAAPR